MQAFKYVSKWIELRRITFLFSCLCLWGCSPVLTVKSQSNTCQKIAMTHPEQFWKNHQNWRAKGAVWIQHQQKKHHVYFNWQQHDQQQSLTLSTAFGITLGRLRWQPNQAHIQTPKQKFKGKHINQLIQKVFHVSIPISSISQAIRFGKNHNALKRSSTRCFHGYELARKYHYHDQQTQLNITFSDWQIQAKN